MTAALLTAISL